MSLFRRRPRSLIAPKPILPEGYVLPSTAPIPENPAAIKEMPSNVIPWNARPEDFNRAASTEAGRYEVIFQGPVPLDMVSDEELFAELRRRVGRKKKR